MESNQLAHPCQQRPHKTNFTNLRNLKSTSGIWMGRNTFSLLPALLLVSWVKCYKHEKKGEFQEAKQSEQRCTMEADCWALHHHSCIFLFLLTRKLRTVKASVSWNSSSRWFTYKELFSLSKVRLSRVRLDLYRYKRAPASIDNVLVSLSLLLSLKSRSDPCIALLAVAPQGLHPSN